MTKQKPIAMPPSYKEYDELFLSARIKPERIKQIDALIENILPAKERYEQVSDHVNRNMPWWFVAGIHCMECSLNFHSHLHNGDPLTERTKHVPAGRPLIGNPPFTWEESATDALMLKQFNLEKNWIIANMLYMLERYNGMGYRKHNINTPYLWSFTNNYSAGKFVADGHFDANAVSLQAGAAAIIKRMEERQLITINKDS
jgi:lysozyme family protein